MWVEKGFASVRVFSFYDFFFSCHILSECSQSKKIATGLPGDFSNKRLGKITIKEEKSQRIGVPACSTDLPRLFPQQHLCYVTQAVMHHVIYWCAVVPVETTLQNHEVLLGIAPCRKLRSQRGEVCYSLLCSTVNSTF